MLWDPDELSSTASVLVLEESGRLRKRRCRHCGTCLLLIPRAFGERFNSPPQHRGRFASNRVKGGVGALGDGWNLVEAGRSISYDRCDVCPAVRCSGLNTVGFWGQLAALPLIAIGLGFMATSGFRGYRGPGLRRPYADSVVLTFCACLLFRHAVERNWQTLRLIAPRGAE